MMLMIGLLPKAGGHGQPAQLLKMAYCELSATLGIPHHPATPLRSQRFSSFSEILGRTNSGRMTFHFSTEVQSTLLGFSTQHR